MQIQYDYYDYKQNTTGYKFNTIITIISKTQRDTNSIRLLRL